MSFNTNLAEAKNEIQRLREKLSDVQLENDGLRSENDDLEARIYRLEGEADSRTTRLLVLARQALPYVTDPLLRYDLQGAIEVAE